jgi:hypothetical protein
MFCAPRLVFDGTEGVGSFFHVLRSRTHFRQYRGRRVPLSCVMLPDSFSPVPRASGPVFMFNVPGLVFGSTEGVGSPFHVLRFRTHFRRYLGCLVPFSCFVRTNSFSMVPWASDPVFMFCTPGLVLSGTEGVLSLSHVLRSQTYFRRYRGRRVPLSCFALPGSFSAVPWALGPVFIFCALGLIFYGTEGVRSRFHVLHALTHFWWYRGRRVTFSYFALDRCPFYIIFAQGLT